MTDFLDIEDMDVLESPIDRLTLEIYTVRAPEAGSDNDVYCNVVFNDGSLLFDPVNHQLVPETPSTPFFASNSTHEFELPVRTGLNKRVSEIADFYIRKAGSNGWLLGSALLFANGNAKPVLGNSQINQFLDDAGHTLHIRDWSTRSLCEASAVPAKHPLLQPHHRIAGPILGHLSDHTAKILYRVDREGKYRLRVTCGASNEIVSQVRTLAPTATYDVGTLEPDTHYRFSLSHVYLGQDLPVAGGDGEFRTFPREDRGTRFSFAFGSCARNSHDVAQSAWTRIRNLAADPASPTPGPPDNIRFFLHLGDTFYFYDEVTDSEPRNLRTMLAAHLSQRRHPGFLDMARVVPSCAVWDDHDFRKDDRDSVGFEDKAVAVRAFRRYWGNKPLGPQFGFADNLTTLITYGNVDIYLLDGRFHRDAKAQISFTREGVCFGKKEQLDGLIGLIRARLQITGTRNRLVILASGSTWNHTEKSGSRQPYGNTVFEEEREGFYSDLNSLVHEGVIKGLVFLSGDIHINEVYEISLESAAGLAKVVAPELVSSPLGRNSDLKDEREEKGERKLSHSSKDNGRGFATLEIDTRDEEPEGNWKLRVRYYEANASIDGSYLTKSYTLQDGQFAFVG